MRSASSTWPRYLLVLVGVVFVCFLVYRDASAPLVLGADRAMIFKRHLYLYAFVLTALVVTAAGVRPRVVAAIIGIAGLSVVTDAALTYSSLTDSEGVSLSRGFLESIIRRIAFDAAKSLAIVALAGGICWVMASREKTAEPGATDNPDDAQRLREDH